MANFYVIDSLKDDREIVKDMIKGLGHKVTFYEDPEKAMDAIQKKTPDVVMLEMQFAGDGTPLRLARDIRHDFEDIPLILTSIIPSKEEALEALRMGAFAYFPKPFRAVEFLEGIKQSTKEKRPDLDNMNESGAGHQESTSAAAAAPDEGSVCPILQGNTAKAQELRNHVEKIISAKSFKLLVLEGPKGCGKESIAEYVHKSSPNKGQRLNGIDCEIIKETQVEKMIKGEIGVQAKAMDYAQQGTLMLQNIELISLELQDYLCDEIKKLPSSAQIIFSFRDNLDNLLDQELISAELYFLICPSVISVPSIRDRLEDAPEILRASLRQFFPILYNNPKRDQMIEAFLAEQPEGEYRQLLNQMISNYKRLEM